MGVYPFSIVALVVVVFLLHPDWGALIRAGRWIAGMVERRQSWPRKGGEG